ncbi:MAG TPA: carboxypeptidase-like regulatory domain-containing protein [Thermoanaerobaculia bacterium]|nr:carboxypeptidase-like regulatory domain-containing protein [Thermoanaerobaculia bacterium]
MRSARIPPRWTLSARLAAAILAALTAACAAAPKPSPQILALRRAPKVRVSGIVVDAETGRPVAGIEVTGLPRGKDYPWCPPDTTGRDGRFSLELAAPAEYSFLLRLGKISVLTPSRDDPGYVDVATEPGHPIDGIRLKLIREAFAGPAPPE